MPVKSIKTEEAKSDVKKTSPKVKAVSKEVKKESDRALRKTRVGVVTSNKMQKTVVVEFKIKVKDPLYKKMVTKTTRFKAHDDLKCDEGDTVEITETRPLSKEKRWRVSKIVEKVK